MRTNAYIDGFNLYYGALEDTAFKWLDLGALIRLVLGPEHEIVRIKYFTAKVRASVDDPGKPIRQATYLRALRERRPAMPPVEVYFGHFLRHTAPMPRAPFGSGMVNVIKTEEKGSDVNLAVHLLNDAWLDAYECAVVVSNDSDLAEAMRMARERGKAIGLIPPVMKKRRKTSQTLLQHCDFVRRLRRHHPERTQMLAIIPGADLHKPPSW